MWKYDQEQKKGDSLYQSQLEKDQGANYYNNNKGATSYLGGGVGYPAGNSYPGTYPAGGNFNNFGSLPGSYYKW